MDDDSDFAPMAVLWDNKPQGFISIVLGSYQKEEEYVYRWTRCHLLRSCSRSDSISDSATKSSAPALSDLITILGVIGGAAVIALFRSDVLFGWYSIGLIIGFFAYFAVGLMLYGKQEVQPWRVENIPPTPMPDTQSNAHSDVRDAS